MAGTPDRTFQPFRSLYARAKLPTVEAPPVAASMSQSFWHHEIVYIQGIYVQILNIYVCMYVCMCIYICVYIYVYIYIYLHIFVITIIIVYIITIINIISIVIIITIIL